MKEKSHKGIGNNPLMRGVEGAWFSRKKYEGKVQSQKK